MQRKAWLFVFFFKTELYRTIILAHVMVTKIKRKKDYTPFKLVIQLMPW